MGDLWICRKDRVCSCGFKEYKDIDGFSYKYVSIKGMFYTVPEAWSGEYSQELEAYACPDCGLVFVSK